MPAAARPGASVERDCEGPVRRRPCQRGCIAASRRRRGGAGAAAPRIRATGGCTRFECSRAPLPAEGHLRRSRNRASRADRIDGIHHSTRATASRPPACAGTGELRTCRVRAVADFAPGADKRRQCGAQRSLPMDAGTSRSTRQTRQLARSLATFTGALLIQSRGAGRGHRVCRDRPVHPPCGCPLFGSRHATCAYSWISPPSRSRCATPPSRHGDS
jgi:hypothetical protein